MPTGWGPPDGGCCLTCRGEDRLPMGLALAKPYKPSSTLTPTKAYASPENANSEAQREAAQTAGTGPKSKGPPCGMPTRCRRPSGSQGPAGGRRVGVS